MPRFFIVGGLYFLIYSIMEKLKDGEYYDWSGGGLFSIPRCQFLLHRVKKIEDKILEWYKAVYYSQGDDYSVRITKKGKWAVSYSNDYPMQHGSGQELVLDEIMFLEAMNFNTLKK